MEALKRLRPGLGQYSRIFHDEDEVPADERGVLHADLLVHVRKLKDESATRRPAFEDSHEAHVMSELAALNNFYNKKFDELVLKRLGVRGAHRAEAATLCAIQDEVQNTSPDDFRELAGLGDQTKNLANAQRDQFGVACHDTILTPTQVESVKGLDSELLAAKQAELLERVKITAGASRAKKRRRTAANPHKAGGLIVATGTPEITSDKMHAKVSEHADKKRLKTAEKDAKDAEKAAALARLPADIVAAKEAVAGAMALPTRKGLISKLRTLTKLMAKREKPKSKNCAKSVLCTAIEACNTLKGDPFIAAATNIYNESVPEANN